MNYHLPLAIPIAGFAQHNTMELYRQKTFARAYILLLLTAWWVRKECTFAWLFCCNVNSSRQIQTWVIDTAFFMGRTIENRICHWQMWHDYWHIIIQPPTGSTPSHVPHIIYWTYHLWIRVGLLWKYMLGVKIFLSNVLFFSCTHLSLGIGM